MEKITCDIEIIKRFRINRYGMPLVFFTALMFVVIIFSTAYNYEYTVKTFIIISITCLILIIIGFWLSNFRTFEKAQLNFHPEGVIMSTKAGFIPLKYSKIKKLSISNIIFNKEKTQFYIYDEDNRKFEIQTDKKVYDGLIEFFPDE